MPSIKNLFHILLVSFILHFALSGCGMDDFQKENPEDNKTLKAVTLVEGSGNNLSIDYPRIKEIVASELESLSNNPTKVYQFICDENERWIYRCNMVSGEIECFSMSSNKLRLLSSTK